LKLLYTRPATQGFEFLGHVLRLKSGAVSVVPSHDAVQDFEKMCDRIPSNTSGRSG
jgi:hypothetical protein